MGARKIDHEHRFDAITQDAAESAFLSRQLEQIKAQTYDLKFPQFIGRDLIPVDYSVSPGANTMTYRQYEPIGMAKIISNYADDLPRVDVAAKEFTSQIRGIGDAYGYDVQEARNALFAGVDIEGRKAAAARQAIEFTIDQIAQRGDAKHNLLGFLNQPNTNTYTVPNGASGFADWARKTVDEILADLHGIANGIVTLTKQVEIPDTIVLPLEQFTLIQTKRVGNGEGSSTVLSHFLSTSPWIKQVVPWYACEGAGAGGTDRMVCYRRDPNALGLVIPQEFEQFPPQIKGLGTEVPCHARCGGVVVYYPLSMSYGDGI